VELSTGLRLFPNRRSKLQVWQSVLSGRFVAASLPPSLFGEQEVAQRFSSRAAKAVARGTKPLAIAKARLDQVRELGGGRLCTEPPEQIRANSRISGELSESGCLFLPLIGYHLLPPQTAGSWSARRALRASPGRPSPEVTRSTPRCSDVVVGVSSGSSWRKSSRRGRRPRRYRATTCGSSASDRRRRRWVSTTRPTRTPVTTWLAPAFGQVYSMRFLAWL
jgi:hypothetical protein